MGENRVLSNLNYSFHNDSNYDIALEETRDIIDIPYFPAQNLVDVSGGINLFTPEKIDAYIPYKDAFGNKQLYGLINRVDSRFLFIRYDSSMRDLRYRFTGVHYPQGRSGYASTYNGETKFYIFGGESNGRCMNDLWEFDFSTETWSLLNFSELEVPINQMPSKRTNASIISRSYEMLVFGGKTDTLFEDSTGTTYIPLNDLWSYDTSTGKWENYDPNRILPRRLGNIVWADNNTVKIIIEGGTNEIGQSESTKLWTVNRVSGVVTSKVYSPPFTVSNNNICLNFVDDYFVIVGGQVYKWDNTTETYSIIYSNCIALGRDLTYWSLTYETKFRGQTETMGSIKSVHIPKLFSTTGTQLKECQINLPPYGVNIHRVNIEDQEVFWYGGLINSSGLFSERTYRFNKNTWETTVYDHDSDKRPTERLYPALTYDKYHNCIWLFGGYDGSKYFNDLWKYDLGSNVWTKVHGNLENSDSTNPNYPHPRFRSGACVAEGSWLYIIAGYSDAESFNDFWGYNIDTNEWSQEYPVDDIPWGTCYYIFEWRDRLWMFNGDTVGVYRYFYEKKQFVKQPLLRGFISSEYQTKIDKKEFLNPPISYSLIGDYFYVWNSEIGSIRIDMTSKEVMDFKREFKFDSDIIWLDGVQGLNFNGLSSYYINISPLFPITKNQLPNSFFHFESLKFTNVGMFLNHDTNLVSDYMYVDSSGIFQVQPSYLYPDKSKLFIENEFSFAGLQSDYPERNLNNESDINDLTLNKLAQPTTTPIQPWFLFNQHSNMVSELSGAVQTFLNPADPGKVYIVYESGNVVMLNTRDMTFFTYFTKIWPGSSICYDANENTLFAFGGVVNNRTAYFQNGLPWHGANLEKKCSLEMHCTETQMSHNGFMEVDFDLNTFNMHTINDYLRKHNVRVVDYDSIRDYLYDLVNDYIDNGGKSVSKESISLAKQKLYLATQPIIDNLSQLDLTYEQGSRPFDRCHAQSIQVGRKMYIFGGAEAVEKSDCCCGGKVTTYYNMLSIGMMLLGQTSKKNADDSGSTELKVSDDNGDPLVDISSLNRSAHTWDMSTRTWAKISDMPVSRRYMGSSTVEATGRYIYIVGGCEGDDFSGATNDIIVYDTYNDSYELVKGIPDTFKPRILPILHWLDDHRLCILYGRTIQKVACKCDLGGSNYRYQDYPVNDAWILDIKSNVIYKAWEDYAGYSGIIIKDHYSKDAVAKDRSMIVMNPYPRILGGDVKLTLDLPEGMDPAAFGALLGMPDYLGSSYGEDAYKPQTTRESYILLTSINLLNGEETKIKIRPDDEIFYDSEIAKSSTAPTGDEATDILNTIIADAKCSGGGASYKDLYLRTVQEKTNFRFRYGWTEEYGIDKNKYIFIVGERTEEAGIEFIRMLASGEGEAHLRFWMCNLDEDPLTRMMSQIVCTYPLPIAPLTMAYDGSKYIYFIWNKYNIWRLNFKALLNDPTGSYWYRLPPLLNGDFMTDSSVKWETFFLPPTYLCMVSNQGMVARMDVTSYTWYVDKKTPPQQPINTSGTVYNVVNFDDYETYNLYLGGISGKYLSLYYKQWDNFFFDLRYLSGVVEYLSDIVSDKLYPAVIKRKRLYVQNHLGHVLYAWVRIDGKLDVQYSMEDFYDAQEIRLYTDYKGLDQKDNFNVDVYSLKKGWVSIPNANFTTYNNEPYWGWDGEYTRRYADEFLADDGTLTQKYSKCPDVYIKIPITAQTSNEPISRVRVRFKPDVSEQNYIVRLNKVEAIDNDDEIEVHDSTTNDTPISMIHIEPVASGTDYSNEFIVNLKNVESNTAKDLMVYLIDNKWLQFSLDGNTWKKATQTTPFLVAATLDPGAVAQFYIRAMNIDDKPKSSDLVVKAYYPYVG